MSKPKSPRDKMEAALNNAILNSQLSELEMAELIKEWAEGWAMRACELRALELDDPHA